MTDYADLEIRLQPQPDDSYSLEMTFQQPNSAARVALLAEGQVHCRFDWQQARRHLQAPLAYGRWLGQTLFHDSAAERALGQALSNAQILGSPLRVRLWLPAPLQPLRWETLVLPASDARLATSENTPLSRFLSSQNMRPVYLRPEAELNALLVVANPGDLDRYEPSGASLAPIDVGGELARARGALGAVQTTILAAPGQATLDQIRQQLREDFDILYLVCHGTYAQGQTIIWLEDERGQAAPTDGEELVTLLAEARTLPRLLVLASCQSAGDGREPAGADSSALATLGPRLAATGVPAVVAMQGYISMETIAQFMPAFFRQLKRDGEIDRAMAAARAAVMHRDDWWMPVLYMRLADGQLRQQQPAAIPDLASSLPPLTRSERTLLRRNLNDHFDLAELVEICFDLDIDFEQMAGASKGAKIISLITFTERHSRLAELVALLRETRPNVTW